MTFHVYTLFGADMVVLYVGQTGNLHQRMRDHQRRFGDLVTCVAVDPCATREEALELEHRRIVELRPLHNKQGNPRFQSAWVAAAADEWWDEFEARLGTPADRAAWLAAHPDADVRTRKAFALAELTERAA